MKACYRRFETRDRWPAYRLFRESVWDYMLQRGMAEPEEAPEIEEYFEQQRDLYLHLERTAAEDWVAEDDAGTLLGWARSIERDGHLQLTHFFVDPAAQGAGVGRGLLERAFAPGRGRQRSIIATESPLALSLYLRHGVRVLGMAFSLNGTPRTRKPGGELEVERLPQTDASLDPFHEVLLASDDSLRLDRYLMTQSSFIC